MIGAIEVLPSPKSGDRFDIYGESKNSKLKVVIELDAHRADQVAKKFISRTALFANENIIYVSLCYPGTGRMNKVKCEKYFKYCSEISYQLSKSSDKEQLYTGYFLSQD